MHMIAPTPVPPFDVAALRKDIVSHITAKRRRFRVKRADIDDLAQSAITKILASIHTYRPDRGEFRAWAFGIVHHVLCHHARDMQRYSVRFSQYSNYVDEHEALEPSPERCVQRQEARRELSNIVENIEPKQLAVFTRFALDDESHAEIGKALGMSEAASQKCYQRTRDKLAECLDDELVIVIPLVCVDCQDKRSDHRASRWSWVYYGGHYTGQIASLLTIGLLALSLKTTTSNEVPTMENAPAAVIVPQDKPAPVMPNETMHQYDKPSDKRESAPEPRVRVVHGTPKNTVGKPTPTTNLPSYNPPVSPASYRQLGR